MNKNIYDNLTIQDRKELMEMLDFLFDNNMINGTEYSWWEDDSTIQLDLKSNLLTLALNDIEEMLDDLYDIENINNMTKSKKARHIKYIRAIIEKHLYVIEEEMNENN